VSLACPWAHRTLIFRKLKKLDGLIGVSIVDPYMLENGWEFRNRDGGTTDQLYGNDYLWQIYTHADQQYSGRVTVPILWDKERQTIVSNESSEIIRMFNSAFDHLTGSKDDFYPVDLRAEIDALNAKIYDTVNNGVYKCGFATTQEAYETHLGPLFATLDELEKRLQTNRYLMGSRLTEADWRLFTTLIRFDPVYVGHFKCNIRRIADYPNIYAYMRELYQMPGIAETVDFYHIKHHYYGSHRMINPTGIVPVGPEQDLDAPHGRSAI
jgi:putative glutathione S-transferase